MHLFYNSVPFYAALPDNANSLEDMHLNEINLAKRTFFSYLNEVLGIVLVTWKSDDLNFEFSK